MSGKRLFRLSGSKKKDPDVAAWFSRQREDLQPLARTWFEQMRRCGPDVQELMHDDCPVACVDGVAFGYVNAFTSHVNVGFFHGADLDDAGDLLEGNGRNMRHLKVRPDGAADSAAIGRLIEDAYLDVKRRIAQARAEDG